MNFFSCFYNSRLGRCETIISGRCSGDTEESEVRNYVDTYCPLVNRMVNGKDSLFIQAIDSDQLVSLITQGKPPKPGSGIKTVHTDSNGNPTNYQQTW